MIIGEINEFKVKRVADISYILDDGDQEVFLHKKEALTEHEVGDTVKAFIYLDSRRRVCASENTPLITVSKPAFLKVVDVKDEIGYFLYYGMPKDLLLSKDDCIFEESEKPMIGDYLFVYIMVSNGSFRARLVSKARYSEYLHPETVLREKDFYKVFVTSRSINGITCYTKEGHEVFISRGNDRYLHRIGEELTVEIIKKIDDTHYHGSLLKKKVTQLDEDSKKVYEYLKVHKDVVLSESMSPIEIYGIFQMSKSAFKNAVGRLYKDRLIELSNGVIKLKVE